MPKKWPEFANGSAAMALLLCLSNLGRPEEAAALQADVLLNVLRALITPALGSDKESRSFEKVLVSAKKNQDGPSHLRLCRCNNSLSTAVPSITRVQRQMFGHVLTQIRFHNTIQVDLLLS